MDIYIYRNRRHYSYIGGDLFKFLRIARVHPPLPSPAAINFAYGNTGRRYGAYVESVDLKKRCKRGDSARASIGASQSRTRFAAGDILARRCTRRSYDTRGLVCYVYARVR